MIIKQSKQSADLEFFPKFSKMKKSRIALLLFSCVLSLVMYAFGAYSYKSGTLYGIRPILNGIFKENYAIPFNYVRGLTVQPEQISIDIKHKNFQKIAYNRKIALERGRLLTDHRDEVPASIRYGDKVIKAKIRLKGDLQDHWRQESKWSFRIQVKGDNTIFGMKRFSIQHPKTRGYLNEWIFHNLLRYTGLISLRYDFIEVILNGKNLGIYALEEHFEKRLVENNERREGTIIRADTRFYWHAKPGLASRFFGAPLDAYQTSKITADQVLFDQFKVAKNLFESFRQGDLMTHKVFDVDRLAMFFAILDLTGHYHASSLDNLSFYYNPITSLLEPIAADNSAIVKSKSVIGASKLIQLRSSNDSEAFPDWTNRLFQDRLFFERYINALEQISNRDFLDRFFEKIDSEYKEKLKVLYRSFPWYSFEKSFSILYENQKNIRDFLTPVKSLHAYLNGVSQNRVAITLEIANIHALPIQIIDAAYEDLVVFTPPDETILQANHQSTPPEYHMVTLRTVENSVWSDSMAQNLKVKYKILGSNHTKSERIVPWSHLDSDFGEGDLIRQPSNIQNFPFLSVDESKDEISVRPGNWNLNENLIIPAGFTVYCGEGVQLNLSDSAKILSYSPLQFVGSEKNPILVYSADSTGQGIVVISADSSSLMENVTFRNLSVPSQNGWELTGAITFYESPVNMINCQFVGNRSEDGLNIIRSKFIIENSLFSHTFSDAFDADFATGRIVNSYFEMCGNDAIDGSGSVIDVQDVLIQSVGDKGLSAGEKSKISINRCKILNARIALASKDLSRITIEDMSISEADVGITVYQKKSEFGPASVTATNLIIDTTEIPYLVEEKSRLTIHSKVIKPNRKNVKVFLYGG